MDELIYEQQIVGIHKAIYDISGNLYLGLVVASGEDDGELLADITMNTSQPLPLNHGVIDIYRHPELDIFLKYYHLGRDTNNKIKISNKEYPLYKFDINEIHKYLKQMI